MISRAAGKGDVVESSETSNIDLESYCTHEIRRQEPPLDSPFLSGFIAGALVTFGNYLLLKYVPNMYSSVSVGGTWSFDNLSSKLFFLTVVLGGLFGGVTLWLLSVTVGRLRVTIDDENRGPLARANCWTLRMMRTVLVKGRP